MSYLELKKYVVFTKEERLESAQILSIQAFQHFALKGMWQGGLTAKPGGHSCFLVNNALFDGG